MKKTLCLLSAVMLFLAVGTGCDKKDKAAPAPTEAASETTTSTTTKWQPEFVKEGDKTVFEVKIDDDEYEKNYMDADGDAVKTEHYKNKKLTYYYTISKPDKNGVSAQKYYGSDGKLFASYDVSGFKDVSGKGIDEETMQKLVEDHNK